MRRAVHLAGTKGDLQTDIAYKRKKISNNLNIHQEEKKHETFYILAMEYCSTTVKKKNLEPHVLINKGKYKQIHFE